MIIWWLHPQYMIRGLSDAFELQQLFLESLSLSLFFKKKKKKKKKEEEAKVKY
jgi:hypothetical protein